MVDNQNGESSETIRRRVELARQVQRERFHKHQPYTNAQMQSRHIRTFCALNSEGEQLLAQVTQRLGLSARSYGRILKVARTIADLSGEQNILQPHLAEAIQYRSLDRPVHS
ncbi:GTP-binding protein EngB [uncultured Desulfuromonas sp.]|uniref:magnesium chelatase subunit ChlI family protein n=1 Tax=uncultured Desulfuromonas sp. TaxID=181013 RepID=UPI002AAB1FEC|nr:GTP-binding protein EngB [uncultured Desulfuromonas sp.]